MKRKNVLVIGMLISTQILFAGGLVTNTNGSAAWVRTISRNATLGVDAVYFNPAGLAQLSEGLHLSLSNQSIFQSRSIISNYTFLAGSPVSYEADLTAPFFPSLYAAYKMNRWTFSAGFNIIGGGGSADFTTGLPSFEIPVASLVPMLGGETGLLNIIDDGFIGAGAGDPGFSNINGYNMSAFFKGSSTYMGYQVGGTYAINDMISVAIGGRLVTVNNSYEGSLTGVTIDAPASYGGTQTPGDYLRYVATVPSVPASAQDFLNGTARALDGATADAQLNAIQKGMGFTPIVGLNLHLSDMVNIAARYEHHTKIELTNETEVDDVGMFPDGEKVRADLPGMFALGVSVNPIKKLTATAGFNYYLDKSAFYGDVNEAGEQINNETSIDENGYSYMVSLEYKLIDILGVSAGYSGGNNGVNDNYQSDFGQGLKSQTVGAGVFVDLGEKITLNAGVAFVMYDDYSKNQSYTPTGFPTAVPFIDTYGKSTTIAAVGIDISL